MKCRGVKKTRELVTRYCIFEEKRREEKRREEKGEAVAKAAASFCVGNFEKET